MKYAHWIAAALLSVLCGSVAHAQISTCEVRLQRATGLSATSLPAGKMLQLDGQTTKVVAGEPAQKICDRVDQMNDPVRSRDLTIKKLQGQLLEMKQKQDGLAHLLNNTSWFKRNYVAGWLGWLAFWSFLLFLCGRWTKPNRR